MATIDELAAGLRNAAAATKNEAATLEAFIGVVVHVVGTFERVADALESLATTVCPAHDAPAIRTRRD